VTIVPYVLQEWSRLFLRRYDLLYAELINVNTLSGIPRVFYDGKPERNDFLYPWIQHQCDSYNRRFLPWPSSYLSFSFAIQVELSEWTLMHQKLLEFVYGRLCPLAGLDVVATVRTSTKRMHFWWMLLAWIGTNFDERLLIVKWWLMLNRRFLPWPSSYLSFSLQSKWNYPSELWCTRSCWNLYAVGFVHSPGSMW